MNLQQYTKIVDGKEIHYFVNENGAIIEVESIEPNTFCWTVVYCTVDLYINIYNDKCDVIAITTINADDIEKVKNTKWKLSNSGYIMNTPKFKGSNIHLSRRILGTNNFVDYINGDKLNNCRNNLRIVTKSQNQMNVNYKGVCKTKSNKFYAYIKINQKLLNLGTYIDEEEALYARWYAETLLFKEYRYPKEEPNILENRKEQIKDYVNRKVQRL